MRRSWRGGRLLAGLRRWGPWVFCCCAASPRVPPPPGGLNGACRACGLCRHGMAVAGFEGVAPGQGSALDAPATLAAMATAQLPGASAERSEVSPVPTRPRAPLLALGPSRRRRPRSGRDGGRDGWPARPGGATERDQEAH
ncbi:unnamed protein product [Prorocentrum cordatum]|uniref:Secreted protein n=1 Tax=Prorocentrum cordatum TaxID=2364126 RepID=A0ABN9WIE4_9DINO|nr:unnamed protein product [Polarella glacialis]